MEAGATWGQGGGKACSAVPLPVVPGAVNKISRPYAVPVVVGVVCANHGLGILEKEVECCSFCRRPFRSDPRSRVCQDPRFSCDSNSDVTVRGGHSTLVPLHDQPCLSWDDLPPRRHEVMRHQDVFSGDSQVAGVMVWVHEYAGHRYVRNTASSTSSFILTHRTERGHLLHSPEGREHR